MAMIIKKLTAYTFVSSPRRRSSPSPLISFGCVDNSAAIPFTCLRILATMLQNLLRSCESRGFTAMPRAFVCSVICITVHVTPVR